MILLILICNQSVGRERFMEFMLKYIKRGIVQLLLRVPFFYNHFYCKKSDGCIPKKHICFLIHNNYSFINPILPLLFWMKENEDCYVTLVFLDSNAQDDYIKIYPKIFAILDYCSNNIILFPKNQYTSKFKLRFEEGLFRHILEYLSLHDRVDTLVFAMYHLVDMDKKKLLSRCFSESRKVIIDYGSFYAYPPTFTDPDPLYIDYVFPPNKGAYSNYRLDHIRNMIDVRSPKFDPWWRMRMLQKDMIGDFPRLQHKYKVICIMAALTGTQGRILDDEKRMFMESLNELKEECSFIFKFHPADLPEDKDNYVNRWIPQGTDWTVSELAVEQLASLGEVCVVVGLTASVFDILIDDTPLIHFVGKREHMEDLWEYDLIEYNGKLIPYVEYYGWALWASETSELVNFIRNAIYEGGCRGNSEKFQTMLPEGENSCKIISDILLHKQS